MKEIIHIIWLVVFLKNIIMIKKMQKNIFSMNKENNGEEKYDMPENIFGIKVHFNTLIERNEKNKLKYSFINIDNEDKKLKKKKMVKIKKIMKKN